MLAKTIIQKHLSIEGIDQYRFLGPRDMPKWYIADKIYQPLEFAVSATVKSMDQPTERVMATVLIPLIMQHIENTQEAIPNIDRKTYVTCRTPEALCVPGTPRDWLIGTVISILYI